jgi:3-oxoacyl-[acyl-carrier protein] reductase
MYRLGIKKLIFHQWTGKMKNRDNKVAAITGGSRGIGLGIARKLAAEGFDLAIIGRREESAVESLNELRKLGRDVIYCRGDISQTADRNGIEQSLYSHYPHINLWVNNAGIAPEKRMDMLQTSEESYHKVLGTNLTGPFFLTQKIANRMVAEKQKDPEFQALIVTISSISATTASVERAEYCISKAGLGMLTQLYACRLAEFDIPVYEVRPGIIRTDMTEAVSEKYDKLFAEGLCLTTRWGTPEDVGKTVASLSRGDFLYSTGQVFMVDGGLTVARL